MSRAIVLVKYPGKLEWAFEALGQIDRAAFAAETKVVLESYQYAFGNSDICVILYALSWSDVAGAVAWLQRHLHADLAELRQMDSLHVGTSTIVGLSEAAGSKPFEHAAKLAEQLVQTARVRTNEDAGRVIREVLLRTYLAEVLQGVSQLSRNLLIDGGSGLTAQECEQIDQIIGRLGGLPVVD